MYQWHHLNFIRTGKLYQSTSSSSSTSSDTTSSTFVFVFVFVFLFVFVFVFVSTMDPEWRQLTLDHFTLHPPKRLPDSAYYNSRMRSASYTHAELRSYKKRQEILAMSPDTRFEYDDIDDDTVDSYWFIGRPMAIFPRYWFHLVRNRARDEFDKMGSFVAQHQAKADPNKPSSPTPLLLLLADHIRKQQFVHLRGQAVIQVQHKYSKFETFTFLEPEEQNAYDILNESLPAFLDRMAETFLAVEALRSEM